MVKTRLEQAIVEARRTGSRRRRPIRGGRAERLLLPNYDEYIVAYTDRSAIFDEAHTKLLDSRGNFLFNHVLVIDGQVMGTWKRTVKTREVAGRVQPVCAAERGAAGCRLPPCSAMANFWGCRYIDL